MSPTAERKLATLEDIVRQEYGLAEWEPTFPIGVIRNRATGRLRDLRPRVAMQIQQERKNV